MNLKEFLEFIGYPTEHYGDFQVVAGPWPFEGKSKPTFENAVVDVCADDIAQDIILLLANVREDVQPKPKLLTLKEFKQKLVSLSDGRLEYSVEFGYSLPNEWRYDLPVYGSATNEKKQLYALCWQLH
ncbi:MAG: hypothetical protein HGB35_06755 [Geobacteraceae bacterium]|nr:hypothetical protein [Geobacteraceae bacterium]